MPRTRLVYTYGVEKPETIPFTAQEEADADAAQVAVQQLLEPWRFWAVVGMAFPNDGLRTLIAAAFAKDATKQAVALARLDYPPGGVFDRADPLFNHPALLAAAGKTSDDIDALWQQASALTV